jgi:PTS system mannose-specific IIB component
MIKLLRLDERLIHGQVATKWSRHTGVDRIMVANDEAASNEIVAKSLLMAAPPTCKTAIKSVDTTLRMMENPKAANHKILMICQTPDDLLKLLTNLKERPEVVQIGNYGRIAEKKADGSARKTYGANLYLYPEEEETLKKVLDLGYDVIYQTIPEDPAESLKKLLG